jgi:hypothetical protein
MDAGKSILGMVKGMDFVIRVDKKKIIRQLFQYLK